MQRNDIILFIFLCFLIFFAGCKKENTPSIENQCSQKTFEVDLPFRIFSALVCLDVFGNTFIIGKSSNNDTLHLIKVDNKGTLLWQKSFGGISGSLTNIVSLDDGSVVFSTAFTGSNWIEDSLMYIGWIQSGNSLFPDNSCLDTYGYNEISGHDSIYGTTYLFKIDKDGLLLWSKEFSGNMVPGKTLTRYYGNNFLFMTYQSRGMVPEPVFDNAGNFLDTVKIPMDKNSLTLYHLDSDGNIKWQNTLNDIYDWWNISGNNCKDIVYTSKYIALSTQKYIVFFDHNGNELNRLTVIPYCNNSILSLTKAEGDNMYVSGGYSYYDNQNEWKCENYFAKISPEGDVFWKNDNSGYLNYISESKVINQVNNSIYAYDETGNLLWRKDFPDYPFVCPNCNGGIVAVWQKNENEITLVKTNSNGDID